VVIPGRSSKWNTTRLRRSCSGCSTQAQTYKEVARCASWVVVHCARWVQCANAAQAWLCDVCGHIWLQDGDQMPTRCARRSCRSMRWIAGQQAEPGAPAARTPRQPRHPAATAQPCRHGLTYCRQCSPLPPHARATGQGVGALGARSLRDAAEGLHKQPTRGCWR
jgi:hypothetical protein